MIIVPEVQELLDRLEKRSTELEERNAALERENKILREELALFRQPGGAPLLHLVRQQE